jgi:dienelactone hydrolase
MTRANAISSVEPHIAGERACSWPSSRQRALIGIAAVLIWLGALVGSAHAHRSDLVAETVAYRAVGIAFEGQYLRGAVRGKRQPGAVLIAPDWTGINPYPIGQAHELAGRGYDVLVADIYGSGRRAKDDAEAGALSSALISDRASLRARIRAAHAALTAKLGRRTPIVALGFSFGGLAVLELGRSGADLAGIIVSSGVLATAAPDQAGAILAPLLILHGTKDAIAPMDQLAQLTAELDRSDSRYRVVLYGGVHHAFFNPAVGTDSRGPLVYSPEAARLAAAEIRAFLEASL